MSLSKDWLPPRTGEVAKVVNCCMCEFCIVCESCTLILLPKCLGCLLGVLRKLRLNWKDLSQ